MGFRVASVVLEGAEVRVSGDVGASGVAVPHHAVGNRRNRTGVVDDFVPCLPGVVPENAVLHHRRSSSAVPHAGGSVSRVVREGAVHHRGRAVEIEHGPSGSGGVPREGTVDDHRGAVGVGYRSPETVFHDVAGKSAVGYLRV